MSRPKRESKTTPFLQVTLQPLPSQPRPPHRGSSAVTLGVSSISPGQRTSMFGCCTPQYPPCLMPPSSGSPAHQIRRAGGCSSPCSTASSSNPATMKNYYKMTSHLKMKLGLPSI